jgi:nucleoredoxin
MRKAALALVFLCQAVLAAPLPLTIKEIGLMLRTGYSNDEVKAEITSRHVKGSLDPASEKTLADAGATADLIGVIKSGAVAISPEEAARVDAVSMERARRIAAQREEDRKFNSLYLAKQAQAHAHAATSSVASPNAIYQLLKGDLVSQREGTLTAFEDQALGAKKLYALYFSAHWCGPCRQFTPTLVEYYNRVAPRHPEFELIFVSNDHSLFGMQTYMREMKMPWPAIDYAKIKGKEEILKYAGSGIPCLVILDSSGKVLSHSYVGKEYVGTQKVLTDLDGIFAKTSADSVAQMR